MIQTLSPVAPCGRQILQQVNRVVAGKEQAAFWMLAAILAGGHILLEDVPGVGKTTLALAFSKALGLQFGRVQFTPDVMPSDVVGYSVPVDGKMVFRPGAVMCNLLLADELNRASSRTQSALLEAMEEGQVTVDGVCHPLPSPFIVIATQNPLGGAGTQPLPDSQLDRFALRTSLGYPQSEQEKDMILRCCGEDRLSQVQQVVTGERLVRLQREVAHTYFSDAVADYTVRLMAATRKDLRIVRGASPRATLSVVAMAKAVAQLQERDFAIPQDVRRAFLHCVPHRIVTRGDASMRLRAIVTRVRPPKVC